MTKTSVKTKKAVKTGFKKSFHEDLDDIFYDLNMLHYLCDEGYLDRQGNIAVGRYMDKHGNPKDTCYHDINYGLENLPGYDDVKFKSDREVTKWVVGVVKAAQKLGSKHIGPPKKKGKKVA